MARRAKFASFLVRRVSLRIELCPCPAAKDPTHLKSDRSRINFLAFYESAQHIVKLCISCNFGKLRSEGLKRAYMAKLSYAENTVLYIRNGKVVLAGYKNQQFFEEKKNLSPSFIKKEQKNVDFSHGTFFHFLERCMYC